MTFLGFLVVATFGKWRSDFCSGEMNLSTGKWNHESEFLVIFTSIPLEVEITRKGEIGDVVVELDIQ